MSLLCEMCGWCLESKHSFMLRRQKQCLHLNEGHSKALSNCCFALFIFNQYNQHWPIKRSTYQVIQTFLKRYLLLYKPYGKVSACAHARLLSKNLEQLRGAYEVPKLSHRSQGKQCWARSLSIRSASSEQCLPKGQEEEEPSAATCLFFLSLLLPNGRSRRVWGELGPWASSLASSVVFTVGWAGWGGRTSAPLPTLPYSPPLAAPLSSPKKKTPLCPSSSTCVPPTCVVFPLSSYPPPPVHLLHSHARALSPADTLFKKFSQLGENKLLLPAQSIYQSLHAAASLELPGEDKHHVALEGDEGSVPRALLKLPDQASRHGMSTWRTGIGPLGTLAFENGQIALPLWACSVGKRSIWSSVLGQTPPREYLYMHAFFLFSINELQHDPTETIETQP